jgi:hypothetical protein
MILDPESDAFYIKPILIKDILPSHDYQKLLQDIEELDISSDESGEEKNAENGNDEYRNDEYRKEYRKEYKEEYKDEYKDEETDQERTKKVDETFFKDMTFIYVISNQVYADKNLFKIGKHKGSKKKLIRRYKTYLIDPIVYYFFPTGTYYTDEQAILQRFSNHRMGTSEYVHLDIERIMEIIQIYFRHKYERCPAVQIEYHRCIYQNKYIDFHEKKINQMKCDVFPNLNISKSNCLESIDFKIGTELLYHLRISEIEKYLGNHTLFDFMKSFMFEFSKSDSVLFLSKFIPNGWNQFFMEWMNEMYPFSSYRIISRKELLKKETFPERLLIITKDETPMDLIMEKISFLKCCLIIEDQNCYSIENECVLYENFFEKVFYFLFYVF